MSEKLKDYQVIDVFCSGTFYKVRHKVTNNIFAWKAYDCSAYTDEQIQNVVNEVKTISKVISGNLLRYYDTILHSPSKTLYFVLEYNSWRSVQELVEECKAAGKHIAENFIWHLLHVLARVCRVVELLDVVVLQKCITTASIFVSNTGEIRVNCFNLMPGGEPVDVMRQVGYVVHTICFRPGLCDEKIKEFRYSDDLVDVISFLTDERNSSLCPNVVMYHPTVLANLDTQLRPKCLSEILLSTEYIHTTSEVNKCDSEKAVELCKTIKPLPRTIFNVVDSPIYCNISPRKPVNTQFADSPLNIKSLSPTLAALALELPGYVPRNRKPYTDVIDQYNCPQRVSEDTLSQQWMTRLIALRQREETLNKRERVLIAKEIVNSPTTKIIPLNDSHELLTNQHSNGITLPPMITQAKEERREWVPRRRRRTSSVRCKGRRKSYGYEDLDSSLSADAGDGSMIITATKFTKENIPRRNIFPDVSSKKVHFTSSNPFVESDESVTLTFYELDNTHMKDKHQQEQGKVTRDITKFKYLDLEKLASEKRSAMGWTHSSPSKQAKITKSIFGNVTNHSIRKTPSKSSNSSQCTNSSRYSVMSRSEWSVDSISKVSEGSISGRTRSSMKLLQTPTAPPDKKGKSRKSLLNFKTPFKFRTSSRN